MRIALVSRVFDPMRGGLERFHVNLANMLAAMGADLTVFAEKGPGSSRLDVNRVRVRRWERVLAPNTVRFAGAARRAVTPEDFDCVISTTPYYPCDIHRAGGGIHKFWYQMRGEEWGGIYRFYKWQPRYRYALELERKIYDPDNVRFQVANSRLVKKQMVDHYGFPEDRIAVVYNGIDFKMFSRSWCEENRVRLRREMNFSEKDFIILFPSNNFKRKGFQILSQAVRSIKVRKNVVVLALGQDRPAGDDINVRFMGFHKNILPYYAVSDCLVLPTLYEPCSNVVLEAMACGRIAVTSPTNGASEFIVNGQNGFVLTSYKDVMQLGGILEQLYADRKKIGDMGQKAYESVKEFSLEKNTNQMMALCKRADHTGMNFINRREVKK